MFSATLLTSFLILHTLSTLSGPIFLCIQLPDLLCLFDMHTEYRFPLITAGSKLDNGEGRCYTMATKNQYLELLLSGLCHRPPLPHLYAAFVH